MTTFNWRRKWCTGPDGAMQAIPEHLQSHVLSSWSRRPTYLSLVVRVVDHQESVEGKYFLLGSWTVIQHVSASWESRAGGCRISSHPGTQSKVRVSLALRAELSAFSGLDTNGTLPPPKRVKKCSITRRACKILRWVGCLGLSLQLYIRELEKVQTVGWGD